MNAVAEPQAITSRELIIKLGEVTQPYMSDQAMRLKQSLLEQGVMVDFGFNTPEQDNHVGIQLECRQRGEHYGMVATVTGTPDTMKKIASILDLFDKERWLARKGAQRDFTP